MCGAMINADEHRAVATAIANAHSKESGAEWFDYREIATTMIAAFDAITKYRDAVALAKNKAMVDSIKEIARGKPVPAPEPSLVEMALAGAPLPIQPLAPPASPVDTGPAAHATATVTSIKAAKGKAKDKVPTL